MLRITQQEFAYVVGLSRQRVNEALISLQARGIISIAYGGLRVRDIGSLRTGHFPRPTPSDLQFFASMCQTERHPGSAMLLSVRPQAHPQPSPLARFLPIIHARPTSFGVSCGRKCLMPYIAENIPKSAHPKILMEAPWLKGLPSTERNRVLTDAYVTVYDEHEVVARQRESVESWMGVEQGLLKVVAGFRSGKSVLFSGIPEGSWVGEGSVLKRDVRHYDIVAMRKSKVVHVPRPTFHWLLSVSFEFNRFVMDHLNERLAQFMAMVETDRMTDPVCRLSRAIVGLYNPVLYPAMGPLLNMSQEELGELAGLTRQRTNSAIKALTAEGYVQQQYGALLVCDLAGLRGRSVSES